jgi:hypothetical protein
MDEGPLGFPRLTSIGPFVGVGTDEINDDRVKEAANRFKFDFNIEDSEGNNPYPKWRRSTTRESGVTGMWIYEKSLMVIEPRSGRLSKVHTDIARNISDRLDYDELEVMPWSSVKTRKALSLQKGWFADVNSIGESMQNSFVRDVLGISMKTAKPRDLWPTIYTLWMTNHPYNTMTTFNYHDEKEDVFKLANAYKQLSFALDGLPEPKVKRTL